MPMKTETEIRDEIKTQKRYLKNQREENCSERDIFYTLGVLKGLHHVLDEKLDKEIVLGEED